MQPVCSFSPLCSCDIQDVASILNVHYNECNFFWICYDFTLQYCGSIHISRNSYFFPYNLMVYIIEHSRLIMKLCYVRWTYYETSWVHLTHVFSQLNAFLFKADPCRNAFPSLCEFSIFRYSTSWILERLDGDVCSNVHSYAVLMCFLYRMMIASGSWTGPVAIVITLIVVKQKFNSFIVHKMSI